MMKVLIIATCCAASLAQPNKMQQQVAQFNKLQASKHVIEKKPHSYVEDCWAPAHLPIKSGVASLLQNVPGAGVDKFKPFKTVLKDGFLPVKCVKDYMYYRGDKFGDNKHDYKLGPVSNVSIVHYDAFVAKEDRAEMTQKICFEFCRTVPNMGFFGIVNGRGCYCTPYFTPMESDSSQCDAGCVGDNTKMCGGKSKSSIFAMHMCDSTKEDLKKKTDMAKTESDGMQILVGQAKKLSGAMQKVATKLQKSFGAVGDSGAASLMQAAKVFAGELEHKAEDAEEAANALAGFLKSASSLGNDFTSPETVTKAERIMEGIDKAWGTGEDVHKELLELEAHAKGEHHAMSLSMGGEAAFLQIEASTGGNHTTHMTTGDAPTLDHVGKDSHYLPGPWYTLCRSTSLEKYARYNHPAGMNDCNVETCGKMAVADEHCVGWFEHWTQNEEALERNRKYGWGEWKYCFCRTANEFNAKKQVPYGWWWNPVTYKYTVEKKPTALDQYYPVMYFVDKKYDEVPATCNGDLVSTPIVGQSAEACAAACDAQIHSCVAFQYFEDDDANLCFMFSKFSTGFYYTGCGKSFLQSGAAPFEAKCYAKLSKFQGTTLKPNPSGKCKQCFKDLTNANRCYK